jgi:hypothetical protein
LDLERQNITHEPGYTIAESTSSQAGLE